MPLSKMKPLHSGKAIHYMHYTMKKNTPKEKVTSVNGTEKSAKPFGFEQ